MRIRELLEKLRKLDELEEELLDARRGASVNAMKKDPSIERRIRDLEGEIDNIETTKICEGDGDG